jgi:hypothetical protein
MNYQAMKRHGGALSAHISFSERSQSGKAAQGMILTTKSGTGKTLEVVER